MSWMKGSTLWIEHDGARGHHGKGNLDASDEAGKQDGWNLAVGITSAVTRL